MKNILSIARQNKTLLPVILVVLGAVMAFHRPLFSLISPAKLDLTIQHAPAIMPAVYKVYNNENAMGGKYSLFKMLVTNNSSNTAQNVEVAYQVPNYIEWKTISKIPSILPGESVVVNCYPSFPDKIVEKNTSSKETVNIKVTGSNISETDNDFPIEIKGRNEFMYSFIPAEEMRTTGEYFDNMPLLACYVTPEDPIIKYYTQKVQEKVLKGETASVQNKEEESIRFLKGIYSSTLMNHMVYSGTSGVPSNIDGVSSTVQSIRLPREVLVGKTGLCIELSLLYASIMSSAGMDPVVFLIPHHAFPGYRLNGHYYAIESTGIAGEGLGGSLTTEQALELGMKNVDDFFKHAATGDDAYRIVDIREETKNGALAMELKDDPFMRAKIDDMGKAFEPVIASVPENTGNTGGNGTRRAEPEHTGGGSSYSGYNLFEGSVTFSYPSSWGFKAIPAGLMPAFKHYIASPDQAADIEVYDFSSYGFNAPSQGIESIRQYLVQMGAGDIQYKYAGQNANGYSVFTGVVTMKTGTSSNIAAAFKQTGRGLVGALVGVLSTANGYQSALNKVIDSLK